LLTPTLAAIAKFIPTENETHTWVAWDITSTVANEYVASDDTLSLMFKVCDESSPERSGEYFTESESFPCCSFELDLDVRLIPAPSALVGLLSMGLMGLAGLVWRHRRRGASR